VASLTKSPAIELGADNIQVNRALGMMPAG